MQPGTYLAALSLDARWSGRLEWTVAGLPGVGALDDYGAGLTSPRCFTCSLGAANSGLAGSVGLTIEDTAGSVLAARQTAGVQESAALPGGWRCGTLPGGTGCRRSRSSGRACCRRCCRRTRTPRRGPTQGRSGRGRREGKPAYLAFM